MRLCARSVTKDVRRLVSLQLEMAGTGLPSRLRLVYLALRPGGRCLEFDRPDVLLLFDANDNKLVHAEREFREQCERLDPLEVSLRLKYRLLLLGSALLPGRAYEVASAYVIAANLRRRVPAGARCALYNPYHLLHYAIAGVVPIDKVFHLAPEYPPLTGAREAIACIAAHEILGYRPEQQRVTLQPHAVIEDRPVVRIYLTQILGLQKLREEAALIEFARWITSRVDVPVEIFLHYLDRNIDECDPRARAIFEEFGEKVRRDASLESLSSCQVSFSGYSSIGYDLLSSDICHVMVVDPSQAVTSRKGEAGVRLLTWWGTRDDVIAFDAPFRSWLDALFAADPSCFTAVFKRSPEEVVGGS